MAKQCMAALRTFRKHLFDAIDVEDLKLDGAWIDSPMIGPSWSRFPKWQPSQAHTRSALPVRALGPQGGCGQGGERLGNCPDSGKAGIRQA